jgi:hypothetical protein
MSDEQLPLFATDIDDEPPIPELNVGRDSMEDGRKWYVFANTGVEFPNDLCTPGSESTLEDPKQSLVGSRSVVILVAR